MRVVKMTVGDAGHFNSETVKGCENLSPPLARQLAQNMNDERDTGNEDVDETSMVCYVAED